GGRVAHGAVDQLGQLAAGGQFQVDGAQPGPQQPAEHQVVGAHHGGLLGDADALVEQGAHQQHGVLVVVGEHGVQAEVAPAGGEPGGGLLVVGQGQFCDLGVGTVQRL